MTDLPETSDMIPMHENNSNQKNEIENPPPDVSARRVRVGALASLCRRGLRRHERPNRTRTGKRHGMIETYVAVPRTLP
jgi:hypothetical protein